MIASFRHKALQKFWEKGVSSKIPADQRNKIRLILDTINEVSIMPQDLLPFRNWQIHQLNGNYAGFWSITVKENWSIIFKFDGRNVLDIDYLDYH
jgi:proteic killer suppression protein